MEFTKDIYFNNDLKNGENATITYSGELFKSGSEHVNIVFGFGEKWNDTTTLPMQKTENGFTAEVAMKDFDTFNFCFSNEHNAWDNNNYSNYISPILSNVIEIVEDTIDYGADYSSSIDEIIEDILGNTVQNDIANNKEADSVDKILESISEETLPEIESLFNELFAPEFESNEPIQQIAQEEQTEDFDNIFVPSEEANAEIIQLFNELFDSASSPEFFENNEVEPIAEAVVQPTIEENKLNVATFNLDGLVSDLLNPVISQTVSSSNEEDISLFDDIKEREEDEETSLTVVDSKDLLVSSRKLSSFYKFKKRIKLACYKLFIKLPKELAKQFWFGHN